MQLPHWRRNMPWFLCFCIMCASSVHCSTDGDVPTTDKHQSKHHGSDEQDSESYQKLQSDSEIDKKEEAMRSDTGEPPGTTDTGQPEAENDQMDDDGERVKTEEEPEVVTETAPVISVPPAMEEDLQSSGTRDNRVKEEHDLVENEEHISGGQEEKLPDINDKVGMSRDDPNTLEEEVDTTLPLEYKDETQIEAPALAEKSIGEGDLIEDGEAEKIDARKDEDGLQGEEGNITSEDLDEDKEPEGTETVKLEDEEKQEEEEDGGKDGIIPDTIPPFDEWKEKMLQKALEEQEKQYGGQDDIQSLGLRQFSVKDSKNYASSDCGAKILSANDEVQKASLVLNFNRDEYMINPCSANIWFIVELCEPIQIKLLEIANLELFSSVPESFRVYTSDRFPAREWRPLGTLYAREERSLQSFLIDEHLFTKFVKVELLTFFGKEHYCPLTVLRIFGTSMEEEIDAEETGAAVLPPNPTPVAELKENGILDHAKDAVISFVKNAAKAFTGEDSTEDCQGEACGKVVPEEVDPTPTTECWNADLTTSIPDVQPEDSESSYLSCRDLSDDDLESEDFLRVCSAAVCDVDQYWRIFPNCCLLVLAQTTLHLCCAISNCYLINPSTREVTAHNIQDDTSAKGFIKTSNLDGIQLEIIPSTKSLIISNFEKGHFVILTSSLLHPSMSETASTLSPSPTSANTGASTQVLSTPAPPAETIAQAQLENNALQHNVEKTIAPTPSFKGNKDIAVDIDSSPSKDSAPGRQVISSSIESIAVLPSSDTTLKTVPASSVSSGGAAGHRSESPPAETKYVDASMVVKAEEEPEKAGAGKMEGVPTGEAQSSERYSSQETKLTDHAAKVTPTPIATEVKVDEGGSQTIDSSHPPKATETIQESSHLPKATEASNDSSHPPKATDASHSNNVGTHAGISNYGSQKDSVFMRLNNRIKSLELNLSLSSKYLEELSKSYNKQMEELQKSFNKTVTGLTEKVVKSQEKHSRKTEDISRIEGQVEELTGTVSSLSLQVEGVLQEVIERHLFLMICEVLFFCSLFMICVRRERNKLRLARTMYEHTLIAPQRRNTLGASNPSQHSPRSSLDRGPLRPGGSLDDLLIIGPTTPLREALKANSGRQAKAKPKYKGMIHARSNGSITDPTPQNQPMKMGRKKMESHSTSKLSNPAGVLFTGSSGLKEEYKSYSNSLGRSLPETIGALNGSSNLKHKKIQNGSKVKR